MNLQLLATLLVFIGNLIIAIIVLLYGKQNKARLYFVIMQSGLIGWITTLYIIFNIKLDSIILDTLAKINFSFGILIGIGLLKFTYNFPDDAGLKTKFLNINRILTVINLFLLSGSVFGLIVSGVEVSHDSIKTIRGPFYTVFFITLMLTIFTSLVILSVKYRSSGSGNKKNQIKYIFLGVLLTAIVAITTNLVIPFVSGISDYGYLGTLSTLFIVGGAGYAIVRHQFLDVKIILGRITYFTLVGMITYISFYLVIGLHLRLFNNLYNTGAYILGFAISIFYVILYNSINSFIRNKITSTLINPGFDPNETINELNKRLSKLLDYKSISEAVLTTLSKTIRSSYEALLLTPAEGSFQLLEGTKKKDLNISTLERCIYIWKTIGNYPIVYERVKDDTPYEFRNMKVWLKDVIEEMERSGIRVIVPLAEEKGIIGMLILGEKDADSMYSSIEVNFLDNLADTVSLAVNRSLLYTEVQDLNINLQKKVDSATADLKDKNVKLGDALAKLEEARRQERDMIDVMGHELRTPITIVRNALSVLDTLVKIGEGKVEPKKLTEYVDMSLESARRELALVETLLSATKIEATRMQVSREKVDMLDVIHDGIEGQKHQAEAKGLEIKFTKPEGEYYGYADRLRIQEVMDNLLSNAVKYTQQGYVEISINKIEKDGMIKVSIKDTGMGISEDDIKNLGKKFFRAKQYINEKEAVVRPGGTGLGLYVVFGLVDKMGGKIEIQSELGKGSIFSFIIPLYTNQKQEIITEKFSKDRVSRLDPKVEAELRKEEVEKTDDKNKSEDKILTP